MARTSYLSPIEGLYGKISRKERDGIIQRQKHFRNQNGNVIGTGTYESFRYVNPRDYRKSLPHGEEANNISIFAQEVITAKAERADPERLAYWNERWHKQLKKGENDTPVNPETKKPRIYHRPDIFIQTVI